MQKKKIVAVLGLAFALAGYSNTAFSGGLLKTLRKASGRAQTGDAFDFEGFQKEPAPFLKEFVKVVDKKYAKDLKKVFIPAFRVEFVTTEQSGARAGFKTVVVGGVLAGITKENLQEITDDAYARFVGELEAQGYEVTPMEELTKSASWAAMTEKPRENPFPSEFGGRKAPSAGWTAVYSPTGLTQYARPGEKGARMGGSEPKHVGNIAKELGASPLYAHFKVSFAEFAKTKGIFKAGSTARASYVENLSVQGEMNVQNISELKTYGQNSSFVKPGVMLELKEKIYLADKIISKSEKAKGLDLFGNKYQSNNLTVDLPVYKDGTLRGIKAAAGLFARAIKENG